MLRLYSLYFFIALTLAATSLAFGQQASASTPRTKGNKVCVADVANSSMQAVFTDRLKERLVEDLQKAQVNAYSAYAATMLADRLGISAGNKMVIKREKCDFMLLSEIAKSKAASSRLETPSNSADSAAVVPLAIDFALFQRGQLSRPVLENSVTMTMASDPTDAALAAMDGVAAQIVRFLPKK